MRLENRESINCLIAVFGIATIVRVRKQPPAILEMVENEAKVVVRGGIQLKDVLNFIDVTSNDFTRQARRFSFNARGKKGIDFIYFPSQSSLKMSLRYHHYVEESALPKLIELGIASPSNNAPLNDDELELLLRGYISSNLNVVFIIGI
jgi:hypothetical protein